jgi:hypothetical protein
VLFPAFGLTVEHVAGAVRAIVARAPSAR